MVNFDKFEVKNLIGSGSSGDVYACLDIELNRIVAIKALRPDLARDEELTHRFRNEARSLARLKHRNIVDIYSVNFNVDTPYMVMELLEGRCLEQLIEEKLHLSLPQKLDIVLQIADGLSSAHLQNIYHRDLKPSNIMVLSDGNVKIMDFGLARLKGDARLTKAGNAVGTPLYMSPEQCLGKEGDGRSDLYSLALILHEMVSGTPVFNADTEFEAMEAQLKTLPPPLSSLVSGVPSALNSAVLSALSKRPDDRPKSVAEFSKAIRGVLSDLRERESSSQKYIEYISQKIIKSRSITIIATIIASIAFILFYSSAFINAGKLEQGTKRAHFLCRDATYSFSSQRSGACSWHGGVAKILE